MLFKRMQHGWGDVMGRIIIRTILGVILGYAIYSWILSTGGSGDSNLLLMLAWGVGIGNSFSFNLSLLGGAFHWAANLSILSFFSFGSGLFGIIALVLMLGVVLSFGWIYGWYILIRDLIIEIR